MIQLMTMTSSNLQVLSLGAGVQSSALLLMSCKGLLPKLDVAIFADVGWEPPAVYQQLEFLKVEGEKSGIPVVTVSEGNLKEDYLRGIETNTRASSIPLFTKAKEGSKNEGRLWRQCTFDYKIKPVHKYIRQELLGLRPRQHAPKTCVVDQWMGISYDEISRVKDSKHKFMQHIFPLVNIPTQMLDKDWRREDCIKWLEDNYNIDPPRSACIGCPYHSNEEWRHIKADPELWADAVEFDNQIRHQPKLKNEAYVHRKCLPLDQIDLADPKDPNLFGWDEHCDGLCGT